MSRSSPCFGLCALGGPPHPRQELGWSTDSLSAEMEVRLPARLQRICAVLQLRPFFPNYSVWCGEGKEFPFGYPHVCIWNFAGPLVELAPFSSRNWLTTPLPSGEVRLYAHVRAGNSASTTVSMDVHVAPLDPSEVLCCALSLLEEVLSWSRLPRCPSASSGCGFCLP